VRGVDPRRQAPFERPSKTSDARSPRFEHLFDLGPDRRIGRPGVAMDTWHGTWHGGSTHKSGTVTYTHTLAIRVWISLVVAPAAVQGNYTRPFDDPLLWAPLAALIGTVGGVVVLVAILVRRRIARPTYPPHS